MKTITEKEWIKQGLSLFGNSLATWKFICPSCKTVQSGQDFLDLKLSKDEVRGCLGFSCIGRFTKNKGCTWTLGGFLQVQEVEVIAENGEKYPRFQFSESQKEAKHK